MAIPLHTVPLHNYSILFVVSSGNKLINSIQARYLETRRVYHSYDHDTRGDVFCFG